MPEQPKSVRFNYIKSNGFRVVHVDGVVGGVAPRGAIFAALFSERVPIPEVTVQHLGEGGILGDEITEDRKVREGIVREVEVGLMMDLQIAEAFHAWLGANIQSLKDIKNTLENKKA